MAGMKSELVSLGVYDIASAKTTFLDANDFGREQYLTGITWSPESDMVYVQVLNRGQNHMRLNKYDASTGKLIATLFEEKSNTYVEPQSGLVFLANNPKQFIYSTNNRDGFMNLYLHDVNGKLIRRLTDVDADVEFVAVDPAGKYVYYLSSEISPVEKQLFRVEVKSGKKNRLTMEEGWHNITMSGDCAYFVDNYSSIKVPRNVDLTMNSGKVVRRLQEVENPNKDYNFGEITLGKIKADDGSDLYYRLIKPMDFDPNKKYPIISSVYPGPFFEYVNTSFRVDDSYNMRLAQLGFIVVSMGHRGGSPMRGKFYHRYGYGKLRDYPLADDKYAIEQLADRYAYIDLSKVGIFGHSGGGFMSTAALCTYPDFYTAAVSSAGNHDNNIFN